jgi:hypothetical protein
MGFGLDESDDKKPVVTSEALSKFKPRQAPKPVANVIESDVAAAQAGFISREPKPKKAVRPTKPKQEVEQSFQLCMRLPSSTLDQFVAFATKHKLSYPKAMQKLLDGFRG